MARAKRRLSTQIRVDVDALSTAQVYEMILAGDGERQRRLASRTHVSMSQLGRYWRGECVDPIQSVLELCRVDPAMLAARKIAGALGYDLVPRDEGVDADESIDLLHGALRDSGELLRSGLDALRDGEIDTDERERLLAQVREHGETLARLRASLRAAGDEV